MSQRVGICEFLAEDNHFLSHGSPASRLRKGGAGKCAVCLMLSDVERMLHCRSFDSTEVLLFGVLAFLDCSGTCYVIVFYAEKHNYIPTVMLAVSFQHVVLK